MNQNLIKLLSDGCFHSGEDLGRELGVSRAAVWKQLQKLEDMCKTKISYEKYADNTDMIDLKKTS